MREKEDLSDSEPVTVVGARRAWSDYFTKLLIHWDLHNVTTMSGFYKEWYQKKKEKTSSYNQGLKNNTSECTTRPTLKLCC